MKKRKYNKIILARNIILIPLSLLFKFNEWYHFGIAQWVLEIGRKYKAWLQKGLIKTKAR